MPMDYAYLDLEFDNIQRNTIGGADDVSLRVAQEMAKSDHEGGFYLRFPMEFRLNMP